MADTTKVETTGTSTGALDAPTDLKDMIVPVRGGYREDNDDFRPDPLFQTGTLDTSDTAGSADSSIREVSPVFEAARAQNLVTAAKALDPDDDTPAELVVLPQGSVTVTGSVRTAEEAREDIAGGLRRLVEDPVELGGKTPAQKEAAEHDEDADAREEQESNRRGDGSTAGSTSTTAQPNVSGPQQSSTAAGDSSTPASTKRPAGRRS